MLSARPSPRRPALAVAAALGAVLLTGCQITSETQARPLGSGAPSPLLISPTATAGPAGVQQEQLYFVRQDELVAVARSAADVSPERALSDLVAGPTALENERGLTSALPATGELVLLGLDGSTAVVELTGAALEGGNNQVLALAQVVATLDAAPGVDDVRFVQDGEPLPVPDADGVLRDTPVSLEDYRGLLAG